MNDRDDCSDLIGKASNEAMKELALSLVTNCNMPEIVCVFLNEMSQF